MILVDTSVWMDHFRTGEPHLVDLLKKITGAGSFFCHWRIGLWPFKRPIENLGIADGHARCNTGKRRRGYTLFRATWCKVVVTRQAFASNDYCAWHGLFGAETLSASIAIL